MLKYDQVIIVSAEKSDETFESNRQRTINLGACLEDCNMYFSKVLISNEGKETAAFAVIPRNGAEFDTVKAYAFGNFDQHMILEQDTKGHLHRTYIDNTSKIVGKLRQVDKVTSDKHVVMNGKTYQVVR